MMEATGIYHEALAEHFHALGYRIAVLNPRKLLATLKVSCSAAKQISSMPS
ncbi:hypothetical protein ULF88_18295 [Halopseudomonas pachastrellae]|nr:hypothetical protein [Halopseudomonas pachastrellae]